MTQNLEQEVQDSEKEVILNFHGQPLSYKLKLSDLRPISGFVDYDHRTEPKYVLDLTGEGWDGDNLKRGLGYGALSIYNMVVVGGGMKLVWEFLKYVTNSQY